LMHELAHAAQNYRWGDCAELVAMGDNHAIEAGFDWEASVFGGESEYRSPQM